MQVTGSNNTIAIQISKDGFTTNNGCARSEWLGADRLFSTPELQKRYDEVLISVFTPAFSLVPTNFFREEAARQILSETVTVRDDDTVGYANLPQLGAVAVYALPTNNPLTRVLTESVRKTDGGKGLVLPEQCYMLGTLEEITEYNKIVASYADGYLHLVVAQGRTLLLCNSFEAPDFTTAEYFIFMVLNKFQLNPEVSTIFFRTPLSVSEEESLYNYFHAVETIL